MKPLGVRLAAGAVTTLLGALAVAQAQKDRQTDGSSTWDVVNQSELATPPEPIVAFADNGWTSENDAPPTFAPAPNAFPAAFPGDAANNVRLVQHTEDPSAAAAASFAPPAFSPPGEDAFSPAPGSPNASFAPPTGDAASESRPQSGDGFNIPKMTLSYDAPPQDDVASAQPATASQPGVNPNQNASQSSRRRPDNAAPSADAPASGFGVPASLAATSGASAPGDDAAAPAGFDGFDPSQLPGAFAAPTSSPADDASAQDDASMDAAGEPAAAAPPSLSFAAMPAAMPANDGMNQSDADAANAESADAAAAAPPAAFGSVNALRGNDAYADAPATDDAPQPMLAEAPSMPAFAPSPATFSGTPSIPPSQPEPAASSSDFANQPSSGYQPTLIANPRVASLPPQSAPTFQSAPPANGSGPEIDSNATINQPGDRRLEGVQSPSVVIHKRAPSEVKVGKAAPFVIQVQNVGSAEALDVRVFDRVPAGMRLVDASPTPVIQGDALLWELGALPAGNERTITIQLVPEEEGELGSVARVTFEAAASVRTMSTRPQLKITQVAPEKVLIGQQLEIELEVSNPGSGDAVGVVLQEDVPEGLEHPKGKHLDNLIGTLRPGEVRRQILRLRAVAPGRIENLIKLTSEDGLTAEHSVMVDVIAPQLQIELAGPSRRFLERQATYELNLANVGTADATNVEIAAYLDRGFTFVGTEFEGQYDPSRHAVFWSLAQLPEGGRGSVPLTLLPVEEGERAIRLEVRGDLGVAAQSERSVVVESLADLVFQVADAADPIELGAETTYEIRVTNNGSKADSNIQVKLQLPAGIELVSSEADAGTDGRGLVQFAPHSQLASGESFVYRVRVRGTAPGTHLTRAIIVSDQAKVPVTKEESTMVYSDQ